MLPFVSTRDPSNWEELMSCSFWWLPSCPAIEAGFTMKRAASLHKHGLRWYRDIWRGGRFLTPLEAQMKFELLPGKFTVWSEVVAHLYQIWSNLLRSSPRKLACREWLAIYGDADSLLPIVVCRADEGFQPETRTSMVKIPCNSQLYKVKRSSKTLEEITNDDLLLPTTWDEYGDDTVQLCFSLVYRVRVLEATKGPKKTAIWWYYGPISKLVWEPGRLHWPKAKDFMKFTSNQGRELLQCQASIPNVVEKKWAGVLPTNYKLRWNNIYDTERVRKEAGLMWMIWHKAVAVNVWRGVVSPEIDQNCPVCLRGIRETIMHRFWECLAAQRAWKWGEAIINFMAPVGERRGNLSAA